MQQAPTFLEGVLVQRFGLQSLSKKSTRNDQPKPGGSSQGWSQKVEPCRPCRKMWLKTQRYKTSKYSQNRDEYTPLMGSYGIFTFFGHLWQKWFDPSPSFFLIHPGTSSSSSLAMWSWPPWHALCRAVQPSTEKCAKTSAPCKSSSRAIFTLALVSGSSTKAGWVERNPHTEISKAMGKIWKIAHLQMMYLLDMMIFSSYVK